METSGCSNVRQINPMKYLISNKTTGYLPEVLSKLAAMDDKLVFNQEHQLSHPADVFLLTFRDAIDSIANLAASTNKVTENSILGQTPSNEELSEIRRQIFELLFYTGNFVEGCQSIIKSIFPQGDKQFQKAARKFKENVESYTSHVSQLINKVKHQHKRPRVFTFTSGGNIIVGYYLEGALRNGLLGPDPELHKNYIGMRTGFSLNRIIPYHLCNLYYVSACLESIVNIKSQKKISIAQVDNGFIKKALAEVERMSCTLLPDEFGKPLPIITKKEGEIYLLEFPGVKRIVNRNTHEATVSLEARMGVKERSLALPYFMVKNNPLN